MKKVSKIAVLILAIGLMSSAALADSISFASGFQSAVTITSNGAGGINLGFGPAAVSGAAPPADSLNTFANNPFLIGGGIVLHGNGTFNPFATSVQVGSSASTDAGLLTGTIDFVSIAQTVGSPGAFAINIGLTGINYSCVFPCVSSGVLSQLAVGGAGNLTFTFGFGTGPGNGPQTMAALLAYSSDAAGTTASSLGFSGVINAVPEPASLALLGSGLLAGGNFVRRKYTTR